MEKEKEKEKKEKNGQKEKEEKMKKENKGKKEKEENLTKIFCCSTVSCLPLPGIITIVLYLSHLCPEIPFSPSNKYHHVGMNIFIN